VGAPMSCAAARTLDPIPTGHRKPSHSAAVAQPPALHRTVNKVPSWSSRRRKLWSRVLEATPRRFGATRLSRRSPNALQRFAGIGQKKAAMAVEMLQRILACLSRSRGKRRCVRHPRSRVFLRTGLARTTARTNGRGGSLSMPAAGAIDYPAWVVGRRWCRAGIPDCPDVLCAPSVRSLSAERLP